MGVVPQRARRPRLIVDYSCFDLNRETLKLAPKEAMKFGKALERILAQIVAANPAHGPAQLTKVDIANGFYRAWLNLSDILKLAASIPSPKGEERLLAFPLVLPMGWTESPPYFCATTETVTNMANQRALNNWKPPPHRLDEAADSVPDDEEPLLSTSGRAVTTTDLPDTIPNRDFKKRLLNRFDVFVDDFIGMGQGNRQQFTNLQHILLHTLDKVFRPLEADNSASRKEPALVKKLLHGDACWTTRKVILGWLIDTLKITIELPPHRVERLSKILASTPRSQKRVTVKNGNKYWASCDLCQSLSPAAEVSSVYSTKPSGTKNPARESASTIFDGTPQQWPGNKKVPLQPLRHRLTCSGSKHFTSASIATSAPSSTYQPSSTSWPMMPPACSTYLMINFSPILILYILR
jgi:hypothetical protein